AEIVELDQVRQAITTPAARRNAALAPLEDGIKVADFQDALMGLAGNRLDAHRKRIEIQEADPVLDHAAGRHMAVHQHQMAAGVHLCVGPDFGQELRIELQVPVIRTDESDLAEVECLAADVDVGDGEVVEPKLGLLIVDDWHSAAAAANATPACPLDD